jgi:hypothetical protein
MSGIMHPGTGAAAPAAAAAQPAAAPQAPVTPQTAQRMRVGDMTMLHQMPPPTAVAEPEAAPFEAEALDALSGLDAQAQAIAVPDQPEVLETQIEVDGQPVTWEQYQALQQKWNQDDLHDELMTKFVTAKIDGQKVKIPVTEAVQGYQRARDYSNGMAEVAAGRRDNERTKQGFLNVLRDMDRGDTFMRVVRALGKEEGFKEAAKLYAIEWHRERQMSPEAREMLQQKRELERRAYMLEQRNRQLEQVAQQVQQQAPSQRQQYQANQLAQMIPIAAQRVGLEDSLMARQAFQLHWDQMAPTLGEEDLTTQFVEQVMRAAKEEVDRAIQRSQAEQSRLAPRTPPVQRLPGAAPAPGTVQPNGQPKRMRVGEMNSVLTRLPVGR